MTIYKVFPNLGEQNASLVFAQEFDNFEHYIFNGKKVLDWNPVKFQWNLKDGKSKSDLIINDIVIVFGAGMDIAINEKAKKALSGLLPENTEFLPISVLGDSTQWYMLNVTNIIPDALDKDKSEFQIRKSGKKGRLIKPFFIEENIPNNSIFVFPEAPSTLMVKGEFLSQAIKQAELTGLDFSPANSNENTVSS